MPTVIITGANRGLGLEFARQYAQKDWRVIACCRNPMLATELQFLNVEVHELDVSKPEAIETFSESLKNQVVDILINNAGVHDSLDHKTLKVISTKRWEDGFKVNVMAPVLLTSALIENLALSQRPVAVTIGSQEGCINMYKDGGLYLYRTTKAGAHVASVLLANDLRERGIAYLCLRPGRTATDMGGSDAPYPIDDTITHLIKVIGDANMDLSGKFIDRSGEEIPWSLSKDLNKK